MMSEAPSRHRARAAMHHTFSAFLFLCTSARAQTASAPVATANQSGEVEILGPRGAQVSVDNQPAVTLPLSAPLSLSAGPHSVVATLDRKTLSTPVSVRAGRALEVRFNFDVQAVSITTPPHALLLETYAGIPPALAEDLAVTTVRSLSKQRLAVLLPPKNATIRSDCSQQLSCLVEQATEHDSDYAITVSVSRPSPVPPDSPARYQLEARIVDRSVSQQAARVTEVCADCTTAQVTERLRTMMTELSLTALSKAKSTLVLTTDPPNADIQIDGVAMGKSPLRRLMWAEAVRIDASLPHHKPQSQRVVLREGTESPVHITLQAEEQETGPSRRLIILPREGTVEREPRPRWRFLAGGIGMGIGAILIGFGAGALSVNGQCVSNPEGLARHCDNLYDTLPLGASLVGVGSAVFVGSGLLLAWPGPRKPTPQFAFTQRP